VPLPRKMLRDRYLGKEHHRSYLAGRESSMSASQRAPVGDTVKSEERWWGGKVIQNKRAKNDVEPRVHWTLNTAHQFIHGTPVYYH